MAGAPGQRDPAGAGRAAAPPADADRRPRPRTRRRRRCPWTKAPEDVIVAAWAEPSRLPPAGGQAQILVRLQKRGGVPFPGVEVRLRTSAGSLFSGGKVLVTDASGRTRDRLTTRSSAHITLNAGGTVYRFRVPVAAPALELARLGAAEPDDGLVRDLEAGARARARAGPSHRPAWRAPWTPRSTG